MQHFQGNPSSRDLQDYAYTPRGQSTGTYKPAAPPTPSGWENLDLFEHKLQAVDSWHRDQNGGSIMLAHSVTMYSILLVLLGFRQILISWRVMEMLHYIEDDAN